MPGGVLREESVKQVVGPVGWGGWNKENREDFP